jgi:hypothetical protein
MRTSEGGPIKTQELDYVEARQNGNFLSRGNVLAVSRNDDEAVCVRKCGDVARALPGKRLDFGRDAGPFEMSGKEVGESRFFVKRFGEVGFEKRQRTRAGAAEHIDCGRDEELEGDHGGDGIAREAEDKGVAAAAEYGGLPWADGDGVEIEFGAEGFEYSFDEVVFAHGDPA